MITSEMKVEIIHRETIKPSSPTPHHLKTLELSVFDQIASDVYVLLLFFYRPHNSSVTSAEISNIPKTSLSKTLTLFYPWAGQFQYNDSICCNDRGVVCFLKSKSTVRYKRFWTTRMLIKCYLSNFFQLSIWD